MKRAQLSPEADEALTRMLMAEGITLAAFLEAIGQAGKKRGKKANLLDLTGKLPEICDDARRITQERRARK